MECFRRCTGLLELLAKDDAANLNSPVARDNGQVGHQAHRLRCSIGIRAREDGQVEGVFGLTPLCNLVLALFQRVPAGGKHVRPTVEVVLAAEVLEERGRVAGMQWLERRVAP